jgi:hypothetical protein
MIQHWSESLTDVPSFSTRRKWSVPCDWFQAGNCDPKQSAFGNGVVNGAKGFRPERDIRSAGEQSRDHRFKEPVAYNQRPMLTIAGGAMGLDVPGISVIHSRAMMLKMKDTRDHVSFF